MRGPGIPGGETARDLAINADLAPTILQATGTRPGLTMDGRSLLPLARHPATETGRALSIESRRFTGIRTERYSYVRYHTGEEELYDLVEDPDQLLNVAGDPSYAEVRSRLADELDRLQDCAGGACRRTPRVSLALDYRLGQENGRRCARNLIRARVEGADAGAAVEVEFDAGGVPVAVDSEPPFRQAMPPLHGLTRVRARVTMIDGREVTLGRRVRACG
jgi:hypothetical protein